MVQSQPEIRFARTTDGVRIAYASSGEGYPLVRAAHWMTHIEFDWRTPIFQPWIDRLSRRYRLLRYDSRGCGLSDRDPEGLSLELLVKDLESVVDDAGLQRFALLGISQGGAVSVAYAALHPERVSHLVLCGAYARGTLQRNSSRQEIDALDAMIKLIEVGWGRANSAFLQLYTSQFFPSATPAQAKSFNEIQRESTSPAYAARLARTLARLDASAYLPGIHCPALVLHCTGDARAPFEEGRFLASGIAGARFVPLESDNHIPLADEPSFERAFEAIESFLPSNEMRESPDRPFPDLTPRELGILELLARGLDNAQIAAHLELSEKTVRNNITQIFDKLQVENRPQAIVRAREAGLGRG